MKKIVLIFGFLCTVILSSAQTDSRRNIIVVESNFIMSTHFSYDRLIATVGNKSTITLGADFIMGTGFGYGSHWIAPEINLLSFGPKHFLETGIQYALSMNNNEPEGDSNSSSGIRVAYRYQAANGLNIRASLYGFLAIDPPIFPTIGIGYTF